MSELKACPCCMQKSMKKLADIYDVCVVCGTNERTRLHVDFEEMKNKIKADAVRVEIEHLKSNRPHWHLSVECEIMIERLSKIEQGEL